MNGIGMMRRQRGFVLFAGAVAASLVFAGVAAAATYSVNDTRDLNQSAAAAAAGTCVSTAGTCTVRAAFEAANENGGASTITVPAGTYPIGSTTASTGDPMTGDFKVNINNNSTAITLTGAGSGSTVINAQGNDRSIEVWSNGVLNASGITFENGSADKTANDLDEDIGGAIVSEGHLTLSNDTFTGNSAIDGGGGVAAGSSAGSTLSVTGSVFQNNEVEGGGGAIATESPNDVSVSFTLMQANTAGETGGGIFGCGPAASPTCTGTAAGLTLNFDEFLQNVSDDIGGGGLGWDGQGAVNITNTLFTQNQSMGSNGLGGGIGNDGPANFNVSNTSFDGNSAEDGGALFDAASNGLNLTQDRFTGNTASTEGGGALVLAANTSGIGGGGAYTAATTILSSEFDGNQADGSGAGGAIAWLDGPLTLEGDSFVLNTAGDAGALYVGAGAFTKPSEGGLLSMYDSTMSRNTAGDDGGAIGVDTKGTALSMFNDTIAFNNAAHGGGVFSPEAFVADGSQSTGFGVENTTIAENSGGDCNTTFNKVPPFGSPIDLGNNNDSDQTCFGGVGGPNDLTGVNPLLSNPANNGGPAAGGPGDTETIQTDAEQSDSPTVDAGNNNGCPSVDERGVSRPQGKACDIGAFEFGANPLTTTTATTSKTTTTSKTSTLTSTTTTHKPTKCKKGHHKSHGKCVKNKKHRKHHKKKR